MKAIIEVSTGEMVLLVKYMVALSIFKRCTKRNNVDVMDLTGFVHSLVSMLSFTDLRWAEYSYLFLLSGPHQLV